VTLLELDVELYEIELVEAAKRLVANGRDKNEFVFERSYCAPDPDGAGMFTVQYEVTISNIKTSRSMVVIGGIGLRWVDQFESALKDGQFD
jgi:hypothetical protein